MKDTPRWVGTSGQHGTESSTSGDLELMCYEAVLSRGRGPGVHISPFNNIPTFWGETPWN